MNACAVPESMYLDHAAATPLLPEVAAAMDAVRTAGFANPSSPHAAGRRAKRLLEEARERILAVVGHGFGPRPGLVFTSGATEANRLGILGLAAAREGRVLHSARDHASVHAAARELAARGWRSDTVPLRPVGTLALAMDRVDARPKVLCATLVCGQSGAREDVAALAAWSAAAADRLLHVDGTQAFLADAAAPFGLPPGMAATLAFAPHKFGGPRGIGGLVVRGDVALVAVAPGVQEAGLRGGTEPVALAVGFAQAVEVAEADRMATVRRMTLYRDRLERAVVAAAREAGIAAHVVAAGTPRAAHIATVSFPGHDRQAVVMAADLEGVCCATGTACASGSSEPAPALVAMGLPESVVTGAVRLSIGRETTADVVDAAVAALRRVFARLAASETRKPSQGPGGRLGS